MECSMSASETVTVVEVLRIADEEIQELERKAAGPCIDALLEPVDRDSFREAIRRASELKGAKALRRRLQEAFGRETEQRQRPRRTRSGRTA
jgi:hypothetical protein